MFEIQGDAGGRRFVAALKSSGEVHSWDVGLGVGVDTKVATLSSAAMRSLYVGVSRPLTVNFGTKAIEVSPNAPLIWFEEWNIPCPFMPDDDGEPDVTATATEENTQLTILLVN